MTVEVCVGVLPLTAAPLSLPIHRSVQPPLNLRFTAVYFATAAAQADQAGDDHC